MIAAATTPRVHEPLHALCGPLCHQLTERSPVIAGEQFPLCWRCAGMCLGFTAALLVWRWLRSAAYPSPRSAPLLAAGLVSPLLIDGAAGTLGVWASDGPARAATGVAFGVGVIWLLSLLSDRPRSKAVPLRAIAAAACLAAALVALAVAGVGTSAIAWAALAGWVGMVGVLAAAVWRLTRPRTSAIAAGGAA